MTELDLDDIQGVIYRGYGSLPAAYFVLLRIENVAGARTWLSHMAEAVATARYESNLDHAVQVAFTREGLATLGLDDTVHFSCEFEDGLTSPQKQRALGDQGTSAPEKWVWGGPGTDTVHVLLMLYAKAGSDSDTPSPLDQLYSKYADGFDAAGLVPVQQLSTQSLPDRKEHFGFTDGIAQPIMADTWRDTPENAGNVVPAGEFLLGYENGYGRLPQSPTIPEEMDREGRLPPVKGGRDLGFNGTYLVFRQLEQDVRAFWECVDVATSTDGQSNPVARDRVAAKMVGRWRSGVSLMSSDEAPDPDIRPDDDFSYADDATGERCPVGAHIRRTNPRASVFRGKPPALLTAANQHRILRRGRAFGPPLAETMEPKDILEATDSGATRGLHFICVNADLGRQFEFVQQTWINNPKFGDGYDELDPILGDHDRELHRDRKGQFRIPGEPLRERISGLKRFVHVIGGAYFFLPSIKALRVIADLRGPA